MLESAENARRYDRLILYEIMTREVKKMDETKFGKLEGKIGPNYRIISWVTAGLIFMSFVLFHFGASTKTALIASISGFAIGLYMFTGQRKNWVEIYDKGLLVHSGREGVKFIPFGKVARMDWDEDIFRFLGVLPFFKFTSVSLYGEGSEYFVTLNSVFFNQMTPRIKELEPRLKG